MPEDSHLAFFRSPLAADYERPSGDGSEEQEAQGKVSGQGVEAETLEDGTPFRNRNEATDAELFYDLFFVANLTVFTNVHEVNDSKTLKQYVGFLCILWFLWYQVAIYDVRFFTESVFEYVARAVQLLVMIVLATAGPKFNVGQRIHYDSDGSSITAAPHLPFFKILTLALCISRVVLCLQYLQCLYLTRRNKKTQLPLGLVAAIYFIAAMVYLGLYWTFDNLDSKSGNLSYITWYVIAISETILVTGISMWWRDISFKGTHLVQRMSLLTLIILGEGVIDVAKKCQQLVQGEEALRWHASTVADIVCAILIIYFIYMLYFGWLNEEHFGSIRQQIWSFLHFPLHVALVLAVEGISQSIMWRAAVVTLSDYLDMSIPWKQLLNNTNASASTLRSVSGTLSESASTIFKVGLETSTDIRNTLQGIEDYNNLRNATQDFANGAQDPVLAGDALNWTEYSVSKTIFAIAGFTLPDKYESDNDVPNPFGSINFSDQQTDEALASSIGHTADVFRLTYGYFFICIGSVVMLCCLLGALSTREKVHYHWVRLGVSSLIGLGLALLAVMDATPDSYYNFVASPWLLPTVTICLFVVVVVNNARPILVSKPKLVKQQDKEKV